MRTFDQSEAEFLDAWNSAAQFYNATKATQSSADSKGDSCDKYTTIQANRNIAARTCSTNKI
jgi:hypothetical protein